MSSGSLASAARLVLMIAALAAAVSLLRLGASGTAEAEHLRQTEPAASVFLPLACPCPSPPIRPLRPWSGLEPVAHFGGPARDVAVEGDIAFVSLGAYLAAFDIAAPDGPHLIGRSDLLPGLAHGLDLDGDTVYVTTDDHYGFTGEGGLVVIDVTDPTSPSTLSSVALQGGATDVDVVDQRAYVAGGGSSRRHVLTGLHIIDVTDPARPEEMGYLDTGGARRLVVDREHAYVTGCGASEPYSPDPLAPDVEPTRIIDVSNPNEPEEAARLPYDANSLYVDRDQLYLTTNYRTYIYDVLRPESPREIGVVGSGGTDPCRGIDVLPDAATGLLWVAGEGQPTSEVLHQHPCVRARDASQPDQVVSHFSALSTGAVTRIARAGDRLVAAEASGQEFVDSSAPYANGGVLRLLDTRSRGALPELGRWSGPSMDVAAVAAAGQYVYMAERTTRGDRIVYRVWVIAPSGGRSASEIVGFVTLGEAQLSGSYGVAAREPYVWLATDEGIRVVEAAQGTGPRLLDSVINEEPEALTVDRDRLYLLQDRAVTVYDVSDPAAPVRRGTAPLDYFDRLTDRTSMVAQNGWVYVLGGRGLESVDVSDPDRPVTNTHRFIHFDREIPTGFDVHWPWGYYISGSSQREVVLRVLDLSNPLGPNVIGELRHPYEHDSIGAEVSGERLFALDMVTGEVLAFDVGDPRWPRWLGATPLPAHVRAADWRTEGVADLDVNPDDGRVYAAYGDGWYHGLVVYEEGR